MLAGRLKIEPKKVYDETCAHSGEEMHDTPEIEPLSISQNILAHKDTVHYLCHCKSILLDKLCMHAHSKKLAMSLFP